MLGLIDACVAFYVDEHYKSQANHQLQRIDFSAFIDEQGDGGAFDFSAAVQAMAGIGGDARFEWAVDSQEVCAPLPQPVPMLFPCRCPSSRPVLAPHV